MPEPQCKQRGLGADTLLAGHDCQNDPDQRGEEQVHDDEQQRRPADVTRSLADMVELADRHNDTGGKEGQQGAEGKRLDTGRFSRSAVPPSRSNTPMPPPIIMAKTIRNRPRPRVSRINFPRPTFPVVNSPNMS